MLHRTDAAVPPAPRDAERPTPEGADRADPYERLHDLPRLRSARLGLDPRTGRPTAEAGDTRAFPEPAEDLQPAPLLVSTDGATVYALSRSGRLATLPVGRSVGLAKPPQSPECRPGSVVPRPHAPVGRTRETGAWRGDITPWHG
jgi:hypothetical protein